MLSLEWDVSFFTYIVASQRNGTLYTGSTDSIVSRTIKHKEKTFKGFTAKYGCARHVWYERHLTRHPAFGRGTPIEIWQRVVQWGLTELVNPGSRALLHDLF